MSSFFAHGPALPDNQAKVVPTERVTIGCWATMNFLKELSRDRDSFYSDPEIAGQVAQRRQGR
jgi:hypothetical protein